MNPASAETPAHRPSLTLERTISSGSKGNNMGFRAGMGLENVARRTLGMFLLGVTVMLWTSSNFLASYIFADDTYSKPYFVTYINTSFFAVSLVPIFLRILQQHGWGHVRKSMVEYYHEQVLEYKNYIKGVQKVWRRKHNMHRSEQDDDQEDPLSSSQARLLPSGDEEAADISLSEIEEKEDKLSVGETAKLSFEFSLLWFIANYLVAGCLEYTSVASSTILTSTSSIFTLLFGALIRVESFTYRKLIGVLASFIGIILISSVDLSSTDNDSNRGNFPHKSQAQIAIGDIMAFGSAVMYGLYAVVMKKRCGNEDRVDMPLFFGLVGLFNVLFLWPGFVILHLTGVEKFELPPTGKIWLIVLLNSASSFISDYCWAYAMLLTTPLVVTVGLSMTIPLSLIGQMWLNEQYSNGIYWVGALVVVGSFVFVNHESKDEDEKGGTVVVVGESSAGMQTPRIVVIAAEGDVEGEELV
ncbi:vacuolar membrane protein [Rutstroemia sp. NJR-2017a BVV2]|nr:vacuolar membrane protein [Rutstroemia sp. NJR-2017a BVV2]